MDSIDVIPFNAEWGLYRIIAPITCNGLIVKRLTKFQPPVVVGRTNAAGAISALSDAEKEQIKDHFLELDETWLTQNPDATHPGYHDYRIHYLPYNLKFGLAHAIDYGLILQLNKAKSTVVGKIGADGRLMPIDSEDAPMIEQLNRAHRLAHAVDRQMIITATDPPEIIAKIGPNNKPIPLSHEDEIYLNKIRINVDLGWLRQRPEITEDPVSDHDDYDEMSEHDHHDHDHDHSSD